MEKQSNKGTPPDFQKLFESAPGLFLVLSPELRIIAVSDAYLEATLTKREVIMGKGIFEVFPDNPNDSEATGVYNLRESLNKVIAKKISDEMSIQKYDIQRPESMGGGFEERHWLPVNSPVMGENNDLKYIIHRVEDVSELVRFRKVRIENKELEEALKTSKSAEKAYLQSLREKENQFSLLINSVKDYAIFMVSPSGIIESWNKGAEYIKGYSENEIIGKHISIFYGEEDVRRGEPQKNLEMAKKMGRYEREGRRFRKDGSEFWADIIFTALKDENGNLIGFSKVTREITEKKKSEEALIKSNERFFKIFNLSPESKLITTIEDGHILHVNNAFGKLFGITSEEAVGKTVMGLKMLSMEDREKYAKGIMSGKNEGEINLRAANGEIKEILFRTEIAELDEKECFFTSYIDITERKKTEAKVVELNQELEKNLNRLQTANDELESFSYSVSHDLRAPLRSIDGYARILLEDYYHKIDEEGKQSLDRIVKSVGKMSQLIDDLLNFSRIGRRELQRSTLDMNNIVQAVIKEQHSSAQHRNINFEVKLLSQASADINLMKQVWINLISNALKYTRTQEETQIEIGSYVENDQNVYYIKDNGVGFDMRYADKLFGVFQRLHKEREFEGTGVGLAIVHRIITRHGGSLWGEGEVGKGASFYFLLPEL